MTKKKITVYDGEIVKLSAKILPESVLKEIHPPNEPLKKPAHITRVDKNSCQLAGVQYFEDFGRPRTFDDSIQQWTPIKVDSRYRHNQISSTANNEGNAELISDRFLETYSGVYLVDPESSRKTLLMNFKIRPQKLIKKIGVDRKETCYLEVSLTCNNITEIFDIPEPNYKKLGTIVPAKYQFCCIEPDINRAREYVQKYLTCVYAKYKADLQIALKYEHTGWAEINSRHTYLHGGLECCTNSKIIPDYPRNRLTEIFKNGFCFLKVGAELDVILIPFLYAHIGFLAKLFFEAKYPSEFVLFIMGKTGSFKTAMGNELFNIFQIDKQMKKLNFDSTSTAIEIARDAAIDDILFLDDLNFSIKSQKRAMVEKFEGIIRCYGDSTSKSRAAHNMKSQVKFNVRGGCVVTAEDEPDVSQSTTLRYITIEVGKGSYNSEMLLKFRNNPSIMRFYFAAFIDFLETNYKQIIRYIEQRFETIHAQYSNNFQFARLSFSAVILKIVADIMMFFGSYYCQAMSEEESQKYLAEFEHVIMKVLLKNEDENIVMEPYKMYAYGLLQCLGNQEFRIANDIYAYVNNIAEYIGFYAKDELWLKHEEVYARILKYFDKQGKTLTATMSKIHIALYTHGISRGSTSSSGKASYLCKSSSKIAGRPNMLVLKTDKLKELSKDSH